jgi:mono/diheme cytochrome c family protein
MKDDQHFMRNPALFFTALIAALLAGCGGSSAPTATPTIDPQSDAGLGVGVFQANCAVCHSIAEGVIVVGPSMAHIATVSATRIDGVSAEDYLRESILYPNQYTVEGFSKGTMRQDFAQVLTSDELDQVVAYLLTLQ